LYGLLLAADFSASTGAPFLARTPLLFVLAFEITFDPHPWFAGDLGRGAAAP